MKVVRIVVLCESAPADEIALDGKRFELVDVEHTAGGDTFATYELVRR